MDKKRADRDAKLTESVRNKSVAVLGEGPTFRAIVRYLSHDLRMHVIQIGFERTAGSVTPCALAAEIENCEALIYVPNFDEMTRALALGTKRRELLLTGTQTILRAAEQAQIDRVIAVTSAMVYGAVAGQEPLPDDAALNAEPDTGLVGDALELEKLFARSALPITILRTAARVGTGVDTATTRHFEAPRVLVLRDVPAAWQLIHIADVAAAVGHIYLHDLTGPLAVGAPGTLGKEAVEQLSDMRLLVVPESVARTAAEHLHRVRAIPMPPNDLNYVTCSWAVASNGLINSGWHPKYDNAQCFEELLLEASKHHAVAGRRLGGKDAAALGVAGAAVALLGTAAAWRRARGNWRR